MSAVAPSVAPLGDDGRRTTPSQLGETRSDLHRRSCRRSSSHPLRLYPSQCDTHKVSQCRQADDLGPPGGWSALQVGRAHTPDVDSRTAFRPDVRRDARMLRAQAWPRNDEARNHDIRVNRTAKSCRFTVNNIWQADQPSASVALIGSRAECDQPVTTPASPQVRGHEIARRVTQCHTPFEVRSDG